MPDAAPAAQPAVHTIAGDVAKRPDPAVPVAPCSTPTVAAPAPGGAALPARGCPEGPAALPGAGINDS